MAAHVLHGAGAAGNTLRQGELHNMAAHSTVLELLEIPYDKVSDTTWPPTHFTVLELLEIPGRQGELHNMAAHSTVLELLKICDNMGHVKILSTEFAVVSRNILTDKSTAAEY